MSRLLFIAVAVTVLVLGCAGQSAQQREEVKQPLPQCLSYCGNEFVACTQEYPGDFSACRRDRASCEEACEEQRALRRMEESDDGEVIAPTDPDELEEPGPTEEPPQPTPELDEE